LRDRVVLKALILVVCLLLSFPAIAAPHAKALDSEESEFLRLINAHRAELGLPELKLSPRLTSAAEWMSRDMADKGYFSHTDSKGRDPFERMAAFGYAYSTAKGENLALGYGSAESAFRAWMGSAGHRQNMESPYYRAIGIGRAYSSTYGWFWTTDFGGLRDTEISLSLGGYSARDGSWYVYSGEQLPLATGRVVGSYPGWDVDVQIQRLVLVDGKYTWRAYASLGDTLSSSSRYSRTVSLPAGRYRVRAVFPGNGRDVLRSVSGYRYLRVR